MATRPSTAKRNGANDPALPQKKRARRRLIGAAALCLLAAVIIPAVFDSEPRPAREGIHVLIPSRDTPINEPIAPSASGSVQSRSSTASRTGTASEDEAQGAPNGRSGPGQIPSGGTPSERANGPASPRPGASAESRQDDSASPRQDGSASSRQDGSATPRPDASASPRQDASASPRQDASASPRRDASASPRRDTSASPRQEAPAAPRSDARAQDGSSARSSARGEARAEREPRADAGPRSGDAQAGKVGVYALQVGAFSNEKIAAEQVERLRKAGQKAYTEKVATAQGEWVRVRVGPFPTREAAEQVRAKLKASGVETALISP